MKLKDYLDSRNLTQQEFADMIGVTRSAISLYCLQKRSPPTWTALQIIKLTKGKVTLEDLLKK